MAPRANFHYEWYDSTQQTLYIRVQGIWTWDDMAALRRETDRLVRAQPHPVTALVDMRDSEHIPSQIFSGVDRLMHHLPNNLARVAVISRSRLMRVAYDSYRRVYPRRSAALPVVFATTPDDALARMRA